MKTIPLFWVLVGVLLGGLLRAQPIVLPLDLPPVVSPAAPAAPAAASANKESKDKAENIIDDSAESYRYATECREWLLQGRFADLEQRAQEWIRTSARNHSGSWLIEAFYFG